MGAGMTALGFVPKRLADIQNDINTALQAIVDPATSEQPFLNATDDSILQQIVGVFAEQLSICWEAAYEASIQFDPLAASGSNLSALVQLRGLLRLAGTYATVSINLIGTAGAIIPAGSQVSTLDGSLVFTTLTTVTLGVGGTGNVFAQCTVKGSVNITTSATALILTPVSGWSGCTFGTVSTQGTFEETDAALRLRYTQSIALLSSAFAESIYAAVVNVPGVTYCGVFQNSTTTTDSRGIPAKEVAVVVAGGSDSDVAAALFSKFPIGVQGYGSTTVVVTDVNGTSYNISFSRPTNVPIYVNVTIHATSTLISPTIASDIANAIIAYAQAQFNVGQSVTISRLYTPINSQPYFSVTLLKIGLSSGATDIADVTIAWNQLSTWNTANIVVTIA
jgi:uncharacterized phage protein gp47/JayE